MNDHHLSSFRSPIGSEVNVSSPPLSHSPLGAGAFSFDPDDFAADFATWGDDSFDTARAGATRSSSMGGGGGAGGEGRDARGGDTRGGGGGAPRTPLRASSGDGGDEVAEGGHTPQRSNLTKDRGAEEEAVDVMEQLGLSSGRGRQPDSSTGQGRREERTSSKNGSTKDGGGKAKKKSAKMQLRPNTAEGKRAYRQRLHALSKRYSRKTGEVLAASGRIKGSMREGLTAGGGGSAGDELDPAVGQHRGDAAAGTEASAHAKSRDAPAAAAESWGPDADDDSVQSGQIVRLARVAGAASVRAVRTVMERMDKLDVEGVVVLPGCAPAANGCGGKGGERSEATRAADDDDAMRQLDCAIDDALRSAGAGRGASGGGGGGGGGDCIGLLAPSTRDALSLLRDDDEPPEAASSGGAPSTPPKKDRDAAADADETADETDDGTAPEATLLVWQSRSRTTGGGGSPRSVSAFDGNVEAVVMGPQESDASKRAASRVRLHNRDGRPAAPAKPPPSSPRSAAPEADWAATLLACSPNAVDAEEEEEEEGHRAPPATAARGAAAAALEPSSEAAATEQPRMPELAPTESTSVSSVPSGLAEAAATAAPELDPSKAAAAATAERPRTPETASTTKGASTSDETASIRNRGEDGSGSGSGRSQSSRGSTLVSWQSRSRSRGRSRNDENVETTDVLITGADRVAEPDGRFRLQTDQKAEV